jgi:TonB family protein
MSTRSSSGARLRGYRRFRNLCRTHVHGERTLYTKGERYEFGQLLSSLASGAAVTSFILATAIAALTASAPAVVTNPKPSPAMVEAEANVSRVKRRPTVKKAVEPDYPKSEKLARNGGIVIIRGIVAIDGTFTEAAVTETNAGPVLTNSALIAARTTLFNPAKDASGNPIPALINYPIEFTFGDVLSSLVSEVEPKFGDAERALGVHGRVIIGGTVRQDGRLADAKVLVSSKSDLLDQNALQAALASTYRPFKDGSGQAVDEPVRFPYEFDNYRTPGKGGGVLRYYCGQFAKDQLWWRSTWPEKERGQFYAMMLGVGVLPIITQLALQPERAVAHNKDFEKRWVAAIEKCQTRPEALFVDVFKPEGQIAKRLAEVDK